MSRRIEGIKRGARRRKRTLLGVVASLAALGVFAITALAVHDEAFQLDGNVLAASTTCVGDTDPAPGCQNLQTVDWDSLFDAAGAEKTLPTDFTASGFDRDFVTNANGSFNTSDNTTFATGSKDTLPITPGWQCNVDNNVLSKNDVMNAYAASYEDPGSGDEILYFALERNANTGTANVAFWFLQDDTVNCVSPGGSTAFTGDHADGDLLVVSEFSNGGVVSTIQVYRWDGGANGSLNPDPVASGVDCLTTTGTDTACGTVNRGTISTPWLTSNKQDGPDHSLRISEFFEGGLNLTASDLGGRCFNVFMADTRSSTSLTATLFDFSRGQLGQCASTTTTTPKEGDGTTNITSEPIPATGQLLVKDSALVEVEGVDTFSGDVTFFLCRSSELRNGSGVLDPTGTCTTGGTQIGTAKPVTSTPSTVVSDAAGLTAADRYCWRAVFSGDDGVGVPGSEDSSAGECFTVTPLQPTLATQATVGPVDFGQKISDKVFLSGTAAQPGTDGIGPGGTINATNRAAANGSIKVTAFGPDSCSTVALAEVSLTVSGDRVDPLFYGGPGSATEFTPSAPGLYVYVASYTGDSPNTNNVAATACSAQPTNEQVLVRQIPTEIKTRQSWFPNDTATISATTGNLAAGGTVVFSLYDNATCSGAAKFSETKSITGGSPTEEVGTNNTSYRIATGYTDAADSLVGRHSWKVVYTPAAGDTAHTGKQSACDAEHFNISYTNDAGPGSALP